MQSHNVEQAEKFQVSRWFLRDASSFIDRFDVLRDSDHMEERGFRTKAVIDLLMSLECSLKSLIVSLSDDTERPEEVCKKLKALSHSHEKLYAEVQKRARTRFRLPKRDKRIFEDLSKLGITVRYSYEVRKIIRAEKESNSLEYLILKTVGNDSWIRDLRNEAVRLVNCAEKAQKIFLLKYAICCGGIVGYDDALNKLVS